MIKEESHGCQMKEVADQVPQWEVLRRESAEHLSKTNEAWACDVMQMLVAKHNWHPSFASFMSDVMEAAYWGPLRIDEVNSLIAVCEKLCDLFGGNEVNYCVPGNNEYPIGSLVSLRHDVMYVIASMDWKAYGMLNDAISMYAMIHREVPLYDEDKLTNYQLS